MNKKVLVKRGSLNILNDFIFDQIARKKEGLSDFRKVFKYCSFLTAKVQELVDEVKGLRNKYSTKNVEGSDPRSGEKYEYKIIPGEEKQKFIDEAGKLDEVLEDIADCPDNAKAGFEIVVKELSKIDLLKLSKSEKDEKGKEIAPKINYGQLIVLDEFLDALDGIEPETKKEKKEKEKDNNK